MGSPLSCILIADFSSLLIPALQTTCILIQCFVDFADLMHTLCRVNVFHSNAAPRQAGAHRPFLRGQRSRGGDAMAPTAGSYAPGRSCPRGLRGRLRPAGRSGGSGGGLPPYCAKRRQRRPPPSRAIELPSPLCGQWSTFPICHSIWLFKVVKRHKDLRKLELS
jgi:hypothetical protein